MQQRLGNSKPLAHPQRISFDLFAHSLLQANQPHNFINPGIRNSVTHPLVLLQVVIAGHMWIELRILNDGTNRSDCLVEVFTDTMSPNKHISFRHTN
ncbi:hypothetical protein D3C75_1063480 [compost metagenome]